MRYIYPHDLLSFPLRWSILLRSTQDCLNNARNSHRSQLHSDYLYQIEHEIEEFSMLKSSLLSVCSLHENLQATPKLFSDGNAETSNKDVAPRQANFGDCSLGGQPSQHEAWRTMILIVAEVSRALRVRVVSIPERNFPSIVLSASKLSMLSTK